MIHDVNVVGDGSSYDYDARPPAHVLGSRGEEAKAVKALVKAMGHMDFNPRDFAAIFNETQSAAMQNRMMDMMMDFIKIWCDRWDTGIVDERIDKNFNTMAKAAGIRDYLENRGMWND